MLFTPNQTKLYYCSDDLHAKPIQTLTEMIFVRLREQRGGTNSNNTNHDKEDHLDRLHGSCSEYATAL